MIYMSTHLRVSFKKTYQIEGVCETTLVVTKFRTCPSYSESRGLSNLIKYSRKERRAHVFEQMVELLILWVEKPINTALDVNIMYQ